MNFPGLDKEQQILRLFGKGDPSAMDKLYAEYADYLAGVCSRYIPDEDEMKDVLQEGFIKIFTKISTFEYRGKGSLKAWSARIVINEALISLRKASSSLKMEEIGTEVPDVPEIEEEPDIDGLSEETMINFIKRLPPGYREVFNLYVIEGKTHKEIAKLLGIKPDTSASQFHKAKKMLAKMIKEYRRNKENI